MYYNSKLEKQKAVARILVNAAAGITEAMKELNSLDHKSKQRRKMGPGCIKLIPGKVHVNRKQKRELKKKRALIMAKIALTNALSAAQISIVVTAPVLRFKSGGK